MCLKINDAIRERTLVTMFQREIKKRGGFCIKTADKFTSGIPDLIIMLNGRVIFVEVKTYKGVVSPIQQYFLETIRKQLVEAYIVRDLPTLKKILDNPL